MIIAILVVVGLCLGSFINALVWRLHEQVKPKKSKRTVAKKDLSILQGRSMCPRCHHALAAEDLIPVISWLALHGRCRYCHKPIAWQYPVVELVTAALFMASYAYWPLVWDNRGIGLLVFWLVSLVGLIALAVYDLKWYELPNRIVYPLIAISGLQALYLAITATEPLQSLVKIGMSVAVAAGIFYVLFKVSNEKWIGGGDVKLGIALGLILADPWLSFLMIFTASLLGTLVSLPFMVRGELKRTSRVPFGPYLIAGTIIVMLFGAALISWYQSQLL